MPVWLTGQSTFGECDPRALGSAAHELRPRRRRGRRAAAARARRAGARRRAPRVDASARSRAPRAALAAHARRARRARGDVVLTLVGNRPDWVADDGRVLPPGLRRAAVHRAAAPQGPAPAPRASRSPRWSSPTAATSRRCARPAGAAPTIWVPVRVGDWPERTPPPRRARPRGPVPDHVHERHRRRAEGRRARPALPRRPAAAGRALARRPRPASSSGARRPAAGASRRATRSSPRGCAAPRRCCTTRASTPHGAPGDPGRASPSTCCAWRRPSTASSPSAPSRARLPTLRGLVAAGEALNPEVLRAWHEATGLWIRDGYGQTETGQITGHAAGPRRRARLDGPPAAGGRRVGRRRRARRSTRPRCPTFFLRLPRRHGADAGRGAPATA